MHFTIRGLALVVFMACVALLAGAAIFPAGTRPIGEFPTADFEGRLPAPPGCMDKGCHPDFSTKFKHMPAKDQFCLKCHIVEDPKKHDLQLKGEEPKICKKCHLKTLRKKPHLHGPVAAGECSSCHDPHGTENSALLLVEGNDGCFECHDDIKEALEKGAFKHSPAQDDCSSCHDPHGSEHKMNLTMAPGPGMCTECHEETLEKMALPVAHSPVKEGRACLNCHDPHASKHEKGLIEQPMKLCLSCHDKAIETKDGKLSDIKGLLASHERHHGPIADESCSDCHDQVHGGKGWRLLMDTYPQEFYATYDEKLYGLCFQCHEAEMLKDAETDAATGFRNGKQNLHYLHVRQPGKGRTCRACHEVHASSQPFQIREGVPFGRKGWILPIRFKPAPEGGSCSPGCHKPYGYDRAKPVENLPKSK